MSAKRKIEVDGEVATALESRAAEQGKTIAELLAEIAQTMSDSATLSPADLQELDRRSTKADLPGGTVAYEEVVRWLETWGTARFKPWQNK